MLIQNIKQIALKTPFALNKHRINIAFNRNELAGATGDIGTFIVFMVGLTTFCNFDPAAILIWSGIFNIVTGLFFGIPMAVQPMKAIGIIAITYHLSMYNIIAAGLIMGIIVLLLACFRVFDKLLKIIPKSVARGIQLGLGLLFFKTGFNLIISSGKWFALNGFLTAIIAAIIVFLFFENKKFPAALIVFALGIIIVLLNVNGLFSSFHLALHVPKLSIPSVDYFYTAFPKLVVPQLPLTITNSLIATVILANDYFPKQKAKNNINNIGLSVGIMNLFACLFGGMPMCHGAGGLASQYRFGARTGGSVVMLGIAKLFFGLFLSVPLLFMAKSFPESILGIMMIFGGVELATNIKDMKVYKDVFVMVMVAGISLVINIAVGFIIGLAVFYFWKIQDKDVN